MSRTANNDIEYDAIVITKRGDEVKTSVREDDCDDDGDDTDDDEDNDEDVADDDNEEGANADKKDKKSSKTICLSIQCCSSQKSQADCHGWATSAFVRDRCQADSVASSFAAVAIRGAFQDEDGDGDSDDDDNASETAPRKKRTKKKKKKKQQSLPASLINTYFRLFEVAIKKSEAARSKAKGKSKKGNTAHDDGTMRGRLLSALLSGVNRAHPYLPRRDAAMEEHVDALYRIAHTSPPAACTQALMLLYNLAVGTPESSNASGPAENGGKSSKAAKGRANADAASARRDRFYRALYSKLSDPAMLSGRQITLFFNLVYKATKNDPDGTRAVACSKRLLHTSFHSGPPVVAASLFLVSEVMKFQPLFETAFDVSSEGVFDPTKREPRAAFVGPHSPTTNHRAACGKLLSPVTTIILRSRNSLRHWARSRILAILSETLPSPFPSL